MKLINKKKNNEAICNIGIDFGNKEKCVVYYSDGRMVYYNISKAAMDLLLDVTEKEPQQLSLPFMEEKK